ncbi:MAG: DAK2 domain-containing protein [Lachnospiraceae bacterium]|jgi:DAK2 domain fusion protein YloV|nr:DAK2 domain-containing protein [Lachnospiraceae bacterium]MEE3460821.1 DAK2 domain-containing protein [Lachnospiraceae bacterium]
MNIIDADLVLKAFLSGAYALLNDKEHINELNVFPVPDGDTGTNMSMTVTSAVKEVNKLENPTLETLTKAVSSGSLRGARGNSGVILSQIFRGFAKSVKGMDEISTVELANAVNRAKETAYKAVMKPKEGTILTVIKDGADKALSFVEGGDNDDIIALADAVLQEMKASLDRTPELLPVLKEAGVVDSGGYGLVTFTEGAVAALKGSPVTLNDAGDAGQAAEKSEEENIKFAYRTDFVIMLDKSEEPAGKKDIDEIQKELRKYLNNIGERVDVKASDQALTVSVHTNAPGNALQKGIFFGPVTDINVVNIREERLGNTGAKKSQTSSINSGSIASAPDSGSAAKPVQKTSDIHQAVDSYRKSIEKSSAPSSSDPGNGSSGIARLNKKKKELKETGFIAVSSGKGLSKIFKELGTDLIVEGGQTMNPSTEDILNAIKEVNAKNVFVLPNNGNIIMAANQAAELTEDKNVYVIPTVNIPQGISVMINYIADRSVEANKELMLAAINDVVCGQVTYAVRDTVIDGLTINKGDFMGMSGKKILSVGKDANAAALSMIKGLADEDSELVSIYYGADVTAEDADALKKSIADAFPDCEIEINEGGQPVYSYIISVE